MVVFRDAANGSRFFSLLAVTPTSCVRRPVMPHPMRIASLFSLLLILVMTGVSPIFGGEAAFEQPIPTVSGTKPAAADQIMSAGLWRVDGTFQSTIRVYNRHIIQHRTVVPVLYMTDGTEYDLCSAPR